MKDTGARRWFLRTVIAGRRGDIGLGSCSFVSLAQAREIACELRKIAKAGGDPIAERDEDKRKSITFHDASYKIHAEQIAPTSKGGKHLADWISSIEPSPPRLPVEGPRPPHLDMTISTVLKRLKVPVTVHGMRSTFRTGPQR